MTLVEKMDINEVSLHLGKDSFTSQVLSLLIQGTLADFRLGILALLNSREWSERPRALYSTHSTNWKTERNLWVFLLCLYSFFCLKACWHVVVFLRTDISSEVIITSILSALSDDVAHPAEVILSSLPHSGRHCADFSSRDLCALFSCEPITSAHYLRDLYTLHHRLSMAYFSGMVRFPYDLDIAKLVSVRASYMGNIDFHIFFENSHPANARVGIVWLSAQLPLSHGPYFHLPNHRHVHYLKNRGS